MKIQLLVLLLALSTSLVKSNLNELNLILEYTPILQDVLINKGNLNIFLGFNFNSYITDLLLNNSLDGLQLTIRQFNNRTSEHTLLKFVNFYATTKSENASISSSVNQTQEEEEEEDEIQVLYNENNYLNKISFNLKQTGDYILCYVFLNFIDNLLKFHTTNMCIDLAVTNHRSESISSDESVHNRGKYYYYKPSFIIIMYTLCALMFIPIIVWTNIMNKAKKKLKQKQKEEKQSKLQEKRQSQSDPQLNTQQQSNSNVSSSCNKLTFLEQHEPLLSKNDVYDAAATKPLKVRFDTCSLNGDEDTYTGTAGVNDEAVHILNSKPWLSSDPLTDSKSFEMNLSSNTIAPPTPVPIIPIIQITDEKSNTVETTKTESRKKSKNEKRRNHATTILTKTISFSNEINENKNPISNMNNKSLNSVIAVEFDTKKKEEQNNNNNNYILSAQRKQRQQEYEQQQHYLSYESNV